MKIRDRFGTLIDMDGDVVPPGCSVADDDNVASDGQSIRVPVVLMDHRQRAGAFDASMHQPGFRYDASVPQPNPDAREIYKQDLQNAWRNPPSRWNAPPSDVELAERVASLLRLARPVATSSGPPFAPRFDQPTRGSDGTDDRRAAYDQMVRRATGAWRTPVGRDAALQDDEPPAVVVLDHEVARFNDAVGRTENWQQHDPATLARDAELVRQVTRRDFAMRLEDAWKQPKGAQQEPDPDDLSAAVEREKEIERWQGRPVEELARAVEVKRRAEHQQRSKALEHAWRGGR